MIFILIIDLIILAVVVIFTVIGYKRGLVKIAFGLCTFVLALVITLILYKPVANLIIDNTEIDENIEKAITDNILPEGVSETELINFDALENNEVYSHLLENELYASILESSEEISIKHISETLSTKIIEAVVMLAIYIIAKIVLRFVTALADLVAKLPLLNTFNSLGGIIVGFLQGCLIVLVAFAIVSLMSPMLDPSVVNTINESSVASAIYNNNLLLNLIMK